MKATDLVNMLGIARQAGVSKAAVANWVERHSDFPRPLDLPGVIGIPIWRWAEVELWLRRTGRISEPPGRWLVQVGKGKGRFTTRYSLDDEGTAWFYYSSVNIGNGYKKRLVAPEGGIVARSYS